MKLDLLRELLALNHAFEQVIHGLKGMEKVPFFQAESIRYARAEVETACTDASREFFDHFADIVENDARWAYKFRREHDRKALDPFDFYLELKEREETRKKKGLPPRAILLPGWDQDDDEQRRVPSPQRRRMTVGKRHRRPTKPTANRRIARQRKAGQ